jgi:hypothetical protein
MRSRGLASYDVGKLFGSRSSLMLAALLVSAMLIVFRCQGSAHGWPAIFCFEHMAIEHFNILPAVKI